ncbi:MAG TPA: NADH-ubiquinone oxidoreductase-F iron-sulfur binding region domain-containing protein [Streptomyces sp.]|uniref:NADH-ubiquinone oxidoreductase-F iron-sulfur binding region domain-containing protein n=1 Tax=Streptomyces sp. TaxID=1931 RepID=UPI002D57ABC8|nr:NADH-ubiquinone oxidoreductase-F iron-sulfur binding region domain-containing protein [Streptomyces sp.]HZG05854.1 NADH-ubiquinone oxidoreductase-F iron-sulfur binding region domain-containing protein [Streptomyces sp.]
MTGPVAALASVGPPRLLAGLHEAARLDRVAHLTQHGSLPRMRAQELVELAENIDLRGRGGAGFPFARKLRAVVESARRRDGRSVVVVNGSEGEPSCLKDTALLLQAPHLVVDGAVLAATALDAEGVWIGVTRTDVRRSVQAAVDERGPASPRVRVSLLPERFVTGESSAMISGIGQGSALPSGRRIRSSDSGLGGLPTLFSNTETFAQLAVAARLGALEYRSAGLPAEPGTVLLTVAGSVVVETPTGVPLPYVLRLCGLDVGQGVLVGGYHGTWLGPEAAWSVTVSRESLASFGAVLGAGAVLPLPETTCPVGETARVAHWMARESAGQCGPCFLGLPSLADALTEVANGGGPAALDAVRSRIATVAGRGACSHPDGTGRFVKSALDAFPEEFGDHALGRGCGRPVAGVLPLPPETGSLPLPALPPGGGGASRPEPEESPEKLVVDWTLCQGHGLCADIVPDVIRLGSDGYPAKAASPVPGHLRQQALRAVRRCPALALRIQD